MASSRNESSRSILDDARFFAREICSVTLSAGEMHYFDLDGTVSGAVSIHPDPATMYAVLAAFYEYEMPEF